MSELSGRCPRCGWGNAKELFEQQRHSLDGKYQFTWQFFECSKRALVFMERMK